MKIKHLKWPNWTLLIITLLLLISLVGCSSSTEQLPTSAQTEIPPAQTNKPENTPTSEPENTAAQPPESPDSEVISIYFYHDSYYATPEYREAITTLINQFNQDHTDQIVVHQSTTHIGGRRYFEDRAKRVDCFLGSIDSKGAANSEAILNLTNFMQAETPEFQQDFEPALLNRAQFEGNLYTLPVYSQIPIMAYNADLLADLGLEPPPPNWTFDDFLNLITAIAGASEEEQLYGFSLVSYWTAKEMFYAGHGLQWRDVSGEFPVVMLNTSEMADTITWMDELTEAGIQFSANDQISDNIFKSGRIGFWTTYVGRQDQNISNTFTLPYNVGIVPLPSTDKPNGPYASGTHTGFYISNQTEHPEACWELGKYFTNTPIAGIPARISLVNSAEWQELVSPENVPVYQAAYADSLANDELKPNSSWFWSPILNWRSEAIQNINNGSDLTEELTLAQNYVNTYLSCMSANDILSLSEDEMEEKTRWCELMAPYGQ